MMTVVVTIIDDMSSHGPYTLNLTPYVLVFRGVYE